MKKTYKILLIVLATIFICNTFIGCKGIEKVEKKKNNIYAEKNLDIPKINRIFDFKIIDNKYILIGEAENQRINIYISDDNGQSWKENNISSLEENMENINIVMANILNEKEYVISYAIYDKEELKDTKTKIINLENNILDIDLSMDEVQVMCKLSFLSNNSLLYMSYTGDVINFDIESGKRNYNYKIDTKEIISVCVVGDYLITNTDEYIKQYDLKTGKEIEKINNLDKYKGYTTKLFASSSKDEFYLVNNEGVFSYNIQEKKLKEEISGNNYSFLNTSTEAVSLQKNSNNEFIILYSNINGEYSLSEYYINKDNKEINDDGLTVYTLHEDGYVKEWILLYNKKNPEANIKYEYGISNDLEITETDAIKVLNTKIMSGKGPDVMFLDKLPIDSFIEKGVLADISDIFSDEKTKENLFYNLIEACAIDGKVYYAPLKFGIPTIVGKNEYIQEITDAKSLANTISKNGKGKYLTAYNAVDVINELYYTSNWINEDKSINKEKLIEFLNNSKAIYEAIKDGHTDEEVEVMSKAFNNESTGVDKYSYSSKMFRIGSIDSSQLLNAFYGEKTNLYIGELSSLTDVSILNSMLKDKQELSYKNFYNNENNAFISNCFIGVNSKSNKIDLAKKFVKELFSKEYQLSIAYNSPSSMQGFLVNKEAFYEEANSRELGSGDGSVSMEGGLIKGTAEIKIKWIDNGGLDNLVKNIESLNTPVIVDYFILDKVILDIESYVIGKSSLDETINKIKSNLEIYLSE